MFDAQEFINETRQQIAEFRQRAFRLKLAGNGSSIVVAVLVCGALLQAILRGMYAAGAQRQAVSLWTLFDRYTGPVWRLVSGLPFPKRLPRGNDDLLPWGVTLAFYTGILLFCLGLKKRAEKLRTIANEAEGNLNLQAPLLMQMSAFAASAGTAQSANIGNVSGTGNTVNATNTINNILHRSEEKSLLEQFWIPLGVAVAAALLGKLLHLT